MSFNLSFNDFLLILTSVLFPGRAGREVYCKIKNPVFSARLAVRENRKSLS